MADKTTNLQPTIKTYSELIKIDSFEDRYNYLRLGGIVGKQTFGGRRYLNQQFYSSQKWKAIRDKVIIRDEGCDLGILDRQIGNRIYIHHMNPINQEDIWEQSDMLLDPEYLICVSYQTHQAIHFGDEHLLVHEPIERKPNDTCLWKGGTT